MKKSGFTEEQIIGFLKQADAGMPVKELCPLRESSFVYLERYAVFQGGRDYIERIHIKG